MENVLLYALKQLTFTGVLWICYQLFVSGNTFHKTNRITVLLIFAAGILLPLVNIPFPYENKIIENQLTTFDWQFLVSQNRVIETNQSSDNQFVSILLWCVYILGVLLLLVRYIVGLVSIQRIISGAEKKQVRENVNIYVTPQKVLSFSWFGYIVISEEDMNKEVENIITHELAHVEYRHSWDLLFSQLYCLVFWWNPFVWLLKKQLIILHEFQADQRVLEQVPDSKIYRKQLIHRCVGAQRIALAHNFETSNLKKRIYMTMKNKSTAKAKWSYAVLVLATTLTMSLISIEMTQAQEKEISKKEPNIAVIGFSTEGNDSSKALYVIDDKETNSSTISQLPTESIISVNVLKGENAAKAYGEKGKNGVVIITTKNANSDSKAAITDIEDREGKNISKINDKTGDALVLIDGKEADYTKLADIDPKNIMSISVLKDKKALEAYGEKGKNGVILVSLKK